MKNAIVTALGLAVMATSVPTFAEEGPFDRIKRKAEEKVKDVRKVERTVEQVRSASSAPTAIANILSERDARSGSTSRKNAGRAGAAPAKFTSQLSCAKLGLGNAFVARGGEYTFSQGISTEKRSGLIDRVDVQATNGCLFEGLGVSDVLYVEFDKAKYSKHSYKIQCVSYDGSEQLDNVHGPKINNYKGKDVMLHTGNSAGYEPTASGSNSSRSGAYKAHLDKRGREMVTFNFASLHTDKSGTDFFCQWFDTNTGKSALALTFRRGPA